jgi:hypothetical protein
VKSLRRKKNRKGPERTKARITTKIELRASGAWFAVIDFYMGDDVGDPNSGPPPSASLVESIAAGPFPSELAALGHLTGPIRDLVRETIAEAQASGKVTVDKSTFGGLRGRLEELMQTDNQQPE